MVVSTGEVVHLCTQRRRAKHINPTDTHIIYIHAEPVMCAVNPLHHIDPVALQLPQGIICQGVNLQIGH